jgi:hypothetical protein
VAVSAAIPVGAAEGQAYLTFRPRPDDPARFDQQTAFYESRDPGVAIMVGGNGAGTTEVSLAKVAKFVLSDQPPPRRDTPFWIIANTYEQTCKVAWKEKLFGHGHIPHFEVDWERVRWYRPNQGWPFEVPLRDWPGMPGRNWTLTFKSYEQGRAVMQAESIGGFLFIEQFPWGLLEEVLRGCREYNFPGSKLAEFTPIDPALSLEIETMDQQGTLPAGWRIYRANTQCAMEAGHVSRTWFDEFFGMVADEARETRMTGRWATYEGAIYPGFNPLVHAVGDETIDFPPNVFYRRSIDWGAGPSNAFVCLWAYRNGLGQWFVFDELYSTDQEKTTIDHLCEVQRRFPWPAGNPHYGATFADPSSPGNIRLAGMLPHYCPRTADGEPAYASLPVVRAANAVHEGIQHVQWLLKVDRSLATPERPGGQPRLFVHRERCPNLVRQMRSYRWIKAAEAGLNPRDARPEPLKKDDHAVDALRYLLFSDAAATGETATSFSKWEERRGEVGRFHGVPLVNGRGR